VIDCFAVNGLVVFPLDLAAAARTPLLPLRFSP
jgi:hypothetical protein